MNKTIGEFLKELREKNNLSQSQLAYKTGISTSGIFRFENGERLPSHDTLEKYAKLFKINKLYLLKLAGYFSDEDLLDYTSPIVNEKIEEQLDTVSNDTSSTIPVYASASAGCGRIADAEPVAFVNVPFKEYDCIGVKVHGESMSPTITNDAIVILKKGAEVLSGEVGIFFVNDETFVKRFVEKDGIILLYSDNTCYEPIIVTKKDDFECCGKVIKTINKI
ncbi:MAG: LexA family protein [Cetobacterium sp.]|uniref:LexA family protein n=1 Tax=Cetobacterium sp. TaxID=2071632 RepID=UPI003F3628CE